MSKGASITRIRGMNDLLPQDTCVWQRVEAAAREVFLRYAYQEIRTPIMERTELFARGIGETTDIVEKEMYTFDDRDGTSLTLRPEGTAGVARAYIENGLHVSDPRARLWYAGPMFRHENVQAGRFRQFHQIGAEAFGMDHPAVDAEMCAMLLDLFASLGLKNLELQINSLGDAEDRRNYRSVLVSYFSGQENRLCENCQRRLKTNPLRVLDCKVEGCSAIARGAPHTFDHLGEQARAHFEGLRECLDAMGIRENAGEVPVPGTFRINPRIVRGLDYYVRTAFEVTAFTGVGSQNAVAGGGRYDQLIAQLGGHPTPAIGFAIGEDRLVSVLNSEQTMEFPGPDFFVVAFGAAGGAGALRLVSELRSAGFDVDLDHRFGSPKSQFKQANKSGAPFAIILGDGELQSGMAAIKPLMTLEKLQAGGVDTELVSRLLDRSKEQPEPFLATENLDGAGVPLLLDPSGQFSVGRDWLIRFCSRLFAG
ncbi:MAG: Histidine--tRNA ligase [Myxococcota bacterium]|nr:Histidine--tRNA ligase [Myxococcota bacterium]